MVALDIDIDTVFAYMKFYFILYFYSKNGRIAREKEETPTAERIK